MKRKQLRALIGIFLVSGSLHVGVGTADAAPKKKKTHHADEAPQSAEIATAMGDLKWGTPREEVLGRFTKAIEDQYRPQIAKATGAIEEDKLRAKMREDLSRLKDSLVEFNGKKTGWDVSFLKGEFTHHNDESLFVVHDDTSQNYYFFIDGKLWKWFKAFNAVTFQGKTFDQFAEAIQARYGKAQRREGQAPSGAGKQHWLEWQDAGTRLRAIDNNQFYGFYCLVFDHKDTLRRLPELRTAKPEEVRGTNSLVESVTDGVEKQGGADDNQDVIDRITGKIRRRQDAPEPAAGQKKPASGSNTSPATPPHDGQSTNDPLHGL